MPKVRRLPVCNKPERNHRSASGHNFYWMQTIEHPVYGEGIVCLINTIVREGLEVEEQVIIRFRNDPPGKTKTLVYPIVYPQIA